jgi:hypothetical protein
MCLIYFVINFFTKFYKFDTEASLLSCYTLRVYHIRQQICT